LFFICREKNATELKLKLENEESNISAMEAEIASTLDELASIEKQSAEHKEVEGAKKSQLLKQIAEAKNLADTNRTACERAQKEADDFCSLPPQSNSVASEEGLSSTNPLRRSKRKRPNGSNEISEILSPDTRRELRTAVTDAVTNADGRRQSKRLRLKEEVESGVLAAAAESGVLAAAAESGVLAAAAEAAAKSSLTLTRQRSKIIESLIETISEMNKNGGLSKGAKKFLTEQCNFLGGMKDLMEKHSVSLDDDSGDGGDENARGQVTVPIYPYPPFSIGRN
jgi:hypothetical protein